MARRSVPIDANFSRWRAHYGFTLDEVCVHASGWDTTALSKFERGRRRAHRLPKLEELADATLALRPTDGLTLDQLADRAPWPAPLPQTMPKPRRRQRPRKCALAACQVG